MSVVARTSRYVLIFVPTYGAVVFATEPIAFAVRERLPTTTFDAGQPGLGVAVWIKVDGAQTLHDQLAAQGVLITTAPFDGPFAQWARSRSSR